MTTLEVDDSVQLPLAVWTAFVKYRSGFRCDKCESDYRLCAHHVDEDRSNCCLANGECLCRRCHTGLHASRRTGEVPWNSGRTGVYSDETKRKIGAPRASRHRSIAQPARDQMGLSASILRRNVMEWACGRG